MRVLRNNPELTVGEEERKSCETLEASQTARLGMREQLEALGQRAEERRKGLGNGDTGRIPGQVMRK